MSTSGICIPLHTPLSTLARTVGAAFAAGNTQVQVALPEQLKQSHTIWKDALESTLPGVSVTREEPDSFVDTCLNDPYVSALFMSGKAEWAAQLREQIRESETKVIFEGEGNEPVFVGFGVDLDATASAIVDAAFFHGGQDPACLKRCHVHESMAPDLIERLVTNAQALSVGSPADPLTHIGPFLDSTELERAQKQLADAKELGARLAGGGLIQEIDDSGAEAMWPAIVTHCPWDAELVQQPTAAPILTILPFKSEEEALTQLESPLGGYTATVFGGSQTLIARLTRSFGNLFNGSTWRHPSNADARLDWGGYGRTSWVWEWVDGKFTQRTGPRLLILEFSKE